MTEERKYIYSIIMNPQGTQASDTFRLSETIFGINNRDIILVPYRDMAAAVSSTHFINFDELDKKELTQLVAIHEQVNTNLMKQYDVIPMRFGLVAENKEEIRNILVKAYIQFKTVLKRVAGKAEFIVQIFWNEKNMLEKIARENIEIQRLKKEMESKGKILGFPSKIKLGKRIFEISEAYRKEYTKDILDNLAARFLDFSAGKLLDTAKTEGREMIMNYSFLIDKTEESTLEFSLNQLAEKYTNELKFKYIGPMAAYSFAVINLSAGNFEVVDNARNTLGLGESATLPEIKEAYYKLAREHHPDKHEYKNDGVVLEEAVTKMKNIVAANEVLTVYCQHYLSALPPEKERACSFKKEDVENSIIIKEKENNQL